MPALLEFVAAKAIQREGSNEGRHHGIRIKERGETHE
jgi:hypothetical protein